jgi:hypothetical protein
MAGVQLTFKEFDIVKKFENSNATVSELRTGVFAPIEKISSKSKTYTQFIENQKKRFIETSWGKTVIKGNILTQTHRDLLDCLFAGAKEIKEMESGGIAIYFSTSDILKSYSGTTSRNTKWLKDKLDEIQTTAIEFRTTNGEDFYSFSIISSFAYSTKHKSYGIIITPEYRKYFEDQLTINYTKELPKLLKVKSALLRAIIRFFWTHSQASTMSIENLLQTIGFPMESLRTKQSAIKEIKESAELLKDYGIAYEPKTKLIYRKNSFDNQISFMNSSNKPKELEY